MANTGFQGSPVNGSKGFDVNSILGNGQFSQYGATLTNNIGQYSDAAGESNKEIKAGKYVGAGYQTVTDTFDAMGNYMPWAKVVSAGLKVGNIIGQRTNRLQGEVLQSRKVNANPYFTGIAQQTAETDRKMKAYNEGNGFQKAAMLKKNQSVKDVLFSNKKQTAKNVGFMLLTGTFLTPWLNKKKYEDEIKEQQRKVIEAQQVITRADDANNGIANFGTSQQMSNELQRMGGVNRPALVGKNGLALDFERAKKVVEWINRPLNPPQGDFAFATNARMNDGTDKLPILEQGGSIIVEGARHHEKNAIPLDNITEHGVPVISVEDGGKIEQHAEVEGGELIFSHEVTTKILELKKDGSKEAAIEAGKIIAREIVRNTRNVSF